MYDLGPSPSGLSVADLAALFPVRPSAVDFASGLFARDQVAKGVGTRSAVCSRRLTSMAPIEKYIPGASRRSRVVTPITRPEESKSGPPLEPGAIGAVV